MKRKLLWRLQTVALAGGLALLATRPATAQTLENTVITNTAEVNWTDANGNTYTPVNDSVAITVGFQAGLSLTPDGGSQSPASPSTGGTMALTVQNVGNGVDTVQVAESITGDPTVISVTNYNWNATNYATIPLLNTALATFELTAGASTVITVTYDVPSSKGGLSANYQLTATSVRDGGESDPGDYDISASETFGVTVIEQVSGVDTTTANLLPGNNQTVVFTVTNNGNGAEDFDLETSQIPAGVLSVVSITGTSVTQGGNPDSARVSGLGPSASVDVTVTFNVANVAAGTVDSLFFLATSVAQPSTNTEGAYIVTVIKPSVTITKEAFTDAGLTTAVSGDVLPGQSIWYKVTVSNASGTAAATSIDVDDDLPTEVSYVIHGDDSSGWTITKLDGPPEHIDATLPSLAATSSAYFWIQVTIN